MQNSAPAGSNNRPGSSRYFIVAAALWLTMGLVWSIDASLVYAFFGGAVYFFFLGFYNRPKSAEPANRRHGPRSSDSKTATSIGNLMRGLYARKKRPVATKSSASGSRVRMAVIFILSILFSAIGIIVFVVWNYAGNTVYYTEIGDDYFYQEQYDSAYRYYQRALSVEPEDEAAALGKANSLFALGKEDSALFVFENILIANPDNYRAAYGKALVAWNRKSYDEATRILAGVLDGDPGNHDALLLMGDCYYVRQRYSEAIGWYEQAYAHEDQRTRILCHVMAYIYDVQGDYPRAIGYYQEALQYDSSVVDIYKRLGELIPGKEGDFFRARSSP